MATATLKENDQIQVSGNDLTTGKGIQEILYFPKVSKDLGENSENNLQEVWVLEDKRLDKFITETKKYDEAAAKLAEAQKSGNPEKIKAAQDAMRDALAKGFGKKKDDSVDPVPQGAYKNLIECVGWVSKRTFYISNADLKKVENEKGRKTFRFETNTMETIERDLMQAIEAGATDSSDGKADEKLKTKFWDIKTKIQKEWKFLEGKTEGQVKTKVIKRLVPNKIVQEFLLSDDNCELIDNAIKFFNDTANFSHQRKEQKRKEITTLLEKKDGKFGHYDWGQVLVGIQEIWGKTEPEYVDEIKTSFESIPLKLKDRKPLAVGLNKKTLPKVYWDASGGAQLMRYSANSGGAVNLDFAEGKVSAKYAADAKFSLLEAGAEANGYLPNNNGFEMKFDIPVKVEKLVPKKTATESEAMTDNANFAFDSFFVLPGAIVSTTERLDTLLFRKAKNPNIKGIMVNIIGHTDAMGSAGYNQKLGQLRAQATFEVFANNYAAWHGYLHESSKSKWGTVEKDFMKLSIWIVKNDPNYFRNALIDTPVGDEERMIDILQRLYAPIVTSQFPHEELETPILVEMHQNAVHPIREGINISIPKKDFGFLNGFDPFSSYPVKIQNKNLVAEYFYEMTRYALNQTNGVKQSYLDLFYHDCVSLPYLSKGESELLEPMSGKSAANRRIELEAWELNPEDAIAQKTIHLGYSRFKFTGMVSCFVGATIGLSAEVEVNTNMGIVQLVGKKKKEDEVSKYEGSKVTPGEKGKNNPTSKIEAFGTAKGEAFAGAKVEAGLTLALEWKSPDVTLKKPSADFSVLASVGGSVTGTAGAGIEGEFKIGFDQESRTFQIKAKAQATWGFGGGGAVCFTVGVQELWDFATLVYTKLQEHDFNFMDIFEDEKDSTGKNTESEINVFEIYNSWVVEQFMEGNVLTGAASAIGGAGILGVYSLLNNFNDLLKKWEQRNRDKEELEKMITALHQRPAMARYLPPEAKGRLLYLLTQYKEITWDDVKKRDLHSKSEEAAVFLITKGIVSARDWQETMEHMANKKGDDYEPYQRGPSKTYTPEEKARRAKNNVVYLRNQLLDEPEDWNKVRKHLSKFQLTEALK